MRILMLSTDFLPNIGGITAHIVGLSAGLRNLGHKVTVVVPQRIRPWSLPWTREEHTQNCHVVRLGVPTLPKMTWVYPFYVANLLQRSIRSGYQVIHWHTFDSEITCRLKGVVKIFTNHTSYFLEYVSDPSTMSRARRLVKPADIVIAPSQELAQATITAGYAADRTRVIPNGVDTNRFSPNVDGLLVRRRYGIPLDECVILCPRRLEKKNGVIYWVRAIPLVLAQSKERVRFVFVGDYRDQNQYSAREEVLSAIAELDLGDQVIFTGAVPNREMPKYFAASDVVVLPSLVEATSIAGLEAMASGKPIVGTNVGGIPEIVNDGETGYLIPPADPPALAEAVQKLVTSPNLRESMGRAARKRAECEFAWSVIAKRTVTVYEEAMNLYQ